MLFSWRGLMERVTAVLRLDEEPSRLAAGMAVGVFIGVSPLYGLHTLLALLAAIVFRLNKAATITGAWINLPWFAPFVYAFSLKLGEAVLRGDMGASWSLRELSEVTAAYLRASPRANAGSLVRMVWYVLFAASKPLFIGTTIVGVVLGILTYFVTLEAVREVRRLRHRTPGGRERPGGPASPGEAAG